MAVRFVSILRTIIFLAAAVAVLGAYWQVIPNGWSLGPMETVFAATVLFVAAFARPSQHDA